jgi:hypothetical protein
MGGRTADNMNMTVAMSTEGLCVTPCAAWTLILIPLATSDATYYFCK